VVRIRDDDAEEFPCWSFRTCREERLAPSYDAS
jgi:hypothetical protein